MTRCMLGIVVQWLEEKLQPFFNWTGSVYSKAHSCSLLKWGHVNEYHKKTHCVSGTFVFTNCLPTGHSISDKHPAAFENLLALQRSSVAVKDWHQLTLFPSFAEDAWLALGHLWTIMTPLFPQEIMHFLTVWNWGKIAWGVNRNEGCCSKLLFSHDAISAL